MAGRVYWLDERRPQAPGKGSGGLRLQATGGDYKARH